MALTGHKQNLSTSSFTYKSLMASGGCHVNMNTRVLDLMFRMTKYNKKVVDAVGYTSSSPASNLLLLTPVTISLHQTYRVALGTRIFTQHHSIKTILSQHQQTLCKVIGSY